MTTDTKKIVLFVNFTDEDFTYPWNGSNQTFPAHDKGRYMERGLAEHFAKHLANRELLKSDDPKMGNYTSPKIPQDVPQFYSLFNKAIIDTDVEVAGEFANSKIAEMNITSQQPSTYDKRVAALEKAGAAKTARKAEDEFEGLKKP